MEYLYLGKIVNTHGIKGEIRILSDFDYKEKAFKVGSKIYIDDEEHISVIEKAYNFANDKHKGQYRKSGEDYIYHPMNVALILISIYADYETISAGLMHDVLEDCDCTPEEMEEEFGAKYL